jgi:hypothetical protein
MARFRLSKNRIVAYGLAYYVSLLKRNTPFSFSRFGDGEWNAVLNVQGANCDGHEYLPQLGADLRNALIDNGTYYYAMQSSAIRDSGRTIAAYLEENNIRWKWHNSDVFHYANDDAKLYPLIKQLQSMNVVVVGPDYLRELDKIVFRYSHFVEVPRTNCYLAKDDVVKQILEIEAKDSSPKVYAFSASMATNVMIHELYPRIGQHAWLIDFGSLWDVYLGYMSRGYFTQGNWQEKTKKNLGL